MEVMIKTSTLAGMAAAGLTAYLLPAGLWLFWRKKTSARTVPLIAGIIAYMVISLARAALRAMILTESMARNPPRYFFAMALISGICEEAGRYILFRYILTEYILTESSPVDAASCGIGHGGFEVIMVNGIDGISLSGAFLGTVYRLMGISPFIKSGCDEAETLALMQKISDVTLWDSIAVIYECISAMAFHIALSVIVWSAVRRGRDMKLFAAAVGIHTLVDYLGAMEFMGVSGSLGRISVNFLCTAALCYFSYRVYDLTNRK